MLESSFIPPGAEQFKFSPEAPRAATEITTSEQEMARLKKHYAEVETRRLALEQHISRLEAQQKNKEAHPAAYGGKTMTPDLIMMNNDARGILDKLRHHHTATLAEANQLKQTITELAAHPHLHSEQVKRNHPSPAH